MDQNTNYKRTVLLETPLYEFIQCDWKAGDKSPMHSHGEKLCSVLVVSGMFENRNKLNFEVQTEIVHGGQSFYTAPGAKHEIVCLSETGVTLHTYVPKINKETSPADLNSISEKLWQAP